MPSITHQMLTDFVKSSPTAQEKFNIDAYADEWYFTTPVNEKNDTSKLIYVMYQSCGMYKEGTRYYYDPDYFIDVINISNMVYLSLEHDPTNKLADTLGIHSDNDVDDIGDYSSFVELMQFYIAEQL